MSTAEVGIKLALSGVEQVQGGLRNVSGAVDGLGRASDVARNALAAIGVGVSVAGLVAFAKSTIDAVDAMQDISERTGVAVKDIAGLQVAFKMSGMEADALQGAMTKLSRGMVAGNAAFDAIGVSAKNADGSMKSVRDMLGDVADKFAGYADGAQKTALAMEIFGKSGADMIPLLNGGRQALEEFDATAKKLGLTMDENTVKQAAKFNDTLDMIGMGAQGVARQVSADLLPTLSGLADQFFTSMTAGDNLKRVSEGLSIALKGLYVAGLGVVATFQTVGKALGGVAAIIATALSGDFAGAKAIFNDLKQDLSSGLGTTLGQMKAAWNATGSASVEAMSAMAGAAKKTAPEVAKLGQSAKEAQSEFAKLQRTINDRIASNNAELDAGRKLTDSEKFRLKVLADIQTAGKSLTATERERLQVLLSTAVDSDDLVEAERRQAEWLKESNKQNQEAAEAAYNKARSLEDQLAQQLDANEAIGLSAAEVARLEAARLDDAAAEKTRMAAVMEGIDPSIAQFYRDQAAALAGLADAKRSGAIKQATADSAKEAAAEWKKTSDKIEDALTDALMRGFESGKGFAETLRDTVVNMFKTMVLRPVVSAIVQPVGQAMAGGLTGSGGASGALSGISNISTLYGAMTGGMVSSIGSTIASAGSLLGSSAMTSFAAGMKGATLAPGLMGPTTAGAGGAMGAGASVAAAAPYVLAAYVALEALGAFKGPTYHHGGAYIADTAGNAMSANSGNLGDFGLSWGAYNSDRSTEFDTATKGYSQAVAAGLKDYATALGAGSNLLLSAGTRFTSDFDDWSEGGVRVFDQAGATLFEFEKRYTSDAKKAAEQFSADLPRAILGALQTMDLNDAIEPLLDSVDALTAPIDQVTATLQKAQTWVTYSKTIEQTFEALGLALGDLTKTFEGSDNFIAAFGGIDQFNQLAGGFYESFYSEAERQATGVHQLNQAFDELGVAMPDLVTDANGFVTNAEEVRSTFKALTISALEAGDGKLAAGLIGLSSALNQLAPAATSAASQVASAAASIASERYGLETRLLELQGNTTALRERELAALDPSNQALQQQIWALEDQAAANERAAQAAADAAAKAQALTSAWQSITDGIVGEILRIRGVLSENALGSFASLQSQFAILTAQARSGDQAAAGQLAGVSQSMLDAYKGQASSYLDYARLAGQTAGSLQVTASGYQNRYGVDVPNDIYLSPVQASRRDRDDWREMREEMRAQREELRRTNQQLQRIADATQLTAVVLDDAARGKNPLQTTP